MEIIRIFPIFLIFVYILVSVIDGTTNNYYVLPDMARNTKHTLLEIFNSTRERTFDLYLLCP